MRLRSTLTIAATAWLALAPTPVAQRPAGGSGSGPRGVWEPAGYPEDLLLTDVFFITPEIGWVSGAGGTILYTEDGGATWAAQLGGEPGTTDEPIGRLRFIDARHGWAAQANTLLRTTDGRSWEKVGSFQYEWNDYAFTTPGVGVYVRKDQIHYTADGGRTWKQVFTCRVKLTVQGLTRDVGCSVIGVHFPTATTGYAVTSYVAEKSQFVLLKTEDGGLTWSAWVVKGVPIEYSNEVFFLDEQRGLVAIDGTLHMTADGGRTWKGLVGTVGYDLRFADPDVGWSITRPNFMRQSLAYTVDGGQRWITREVAFPAFVTALSIPRRDRAYVVGEHGMIYRYRVIAASAPMVDGALPGPTMPVFDSPLDEGVETLDEEFEDLETQLEDAADGAAADTTMPFVDSCCAESMNEMQAAVDALQPLLPPFLTKYRNVNLVIAGLRLLGLLPDRLAEVRAALDRLRHARGSVAAATALAELAAAVDSLGVTTRQAFQEVPPAADTDGTGETPGAEAVDVSPANASPADSSTAQPASAADAARRKAEQEAKRRLDAAKRRLRPRIPE